MNCERCKKKADAYLQGKLPDGIRIQVEVHLTSCTECAALFQMWSLADRIMDEEKEVIVNPFLATRIMERIEALEDKRVPKHVPVFQQILKPALISLSIAAATFFGVLSGNIYQPASTQGRVPVELSYMNDASLESVDFYASN